MTESEFQSLVIKELKTRFPSAVIFKASDMGIQGFPDIVILHGRHWAALEVKKSRKSKRQPNQDFWVTELDKMSYSTFIYPENKEDVYREMELALST